MRIVVACVRTPDVDGKGRRKETRAFSSFTGELEAMADWFTAEGVTEVVMEATGSYWKPVWYVLEERAFELKLVNAQHVKILPGRKSDVLDAEWLAELLEHGLLRASFVPPLVIRELRDLTRYRKRLIQAHTSVPTDPEDPRGRRHQARLGRLRRVGRLGPAHVAGVGGR
jgi:transposase